MEVFGREAETADVVARLRDRRLVTITGPGGIGKTALAQVAASIVGPEFPYGAIPIDLTRVDDAEGVFEAVAGQLGYADFASLLNSPSDQPALIVIDNCEHVLDAAADVTAQMLAACRMPTILTTSRSPLDLPEESILNLGALPVPDADGVEPAGAALEMFLARARDHGVEMSSADLVQAAEVCRRLDGVPLAIELAAARLRTISIVELIAELEAAPHALARRRFRGQASHRSVGDLVAWSYDLLDEQSRRCFVRLGVFAGPFTRDMAHRVAGEDPEAAQRSSAALDQLVAASLVTADTSGDITWFRLLHPVRAVARARLEESGELADVRSRFVDEVVRLATDVIGRASTGWGADELNELLSLYDNVATSLRWTLAHDEQPRRSLTLLAVLWGVVHQAHTAEIRMLGEEVLDRWSEPTDALWPDAAATVATCRFLLGDTDGTLDLAGVALGPAEQSSPYAPATLRRVLAQTMRALGRTEEACEMFREAADAAAVHGNHGLEMELRVSEGLMVAELGDVDAGLDLIERVRREAAERGAPINHAWATACRGAALLRRDAAAARPVIEAALDEARSIGYPAGQVFGLRSLAAARLELGDVPGAARAVLDLIDELLQRGGLNDLRMALDHGAVVLERMGDARWADLAATAAALPVTSISTSVESDVFDRARPVGTVLSVRDVYVVTREALGAVVDGGVTAAAMSTMEAETGSAAATGAEMIREGDVWRITFGHSTIRLTAAKGLDDLARLLSAPGREISALDLMGSAVVGGSAEDEIIDRQARRRFEERARDLQSEIEEAERDNDIGRVERLRVELDAIVDQLAASLGLGARARTTTGAAERARSAVTQRIRSVIRRIERHHGELGAHMRASIDTGAYCRYRPANPTIWVVREHADQR